MPRRRIIDPEFFPDPLIGHLRVEQRLFYIATWLFADDAGLFEANPPRLKLHAFPYDAEITEAHVSSYLDDLERSRRLLSYTSDERRYALIKTFHRHQRIDRPTTSKLPRPPANVLDQLDPKSRAIVLARTNALQHPTPASPYQVATRLADYSSSARGALTESHVKGLAEGKRSQSNQDEVNLTTAAAQQAANRSGVLPDPQTNLPSRDADGDVDMYRDGRVRDAAGKTYSSWEDYLDQRRAAAFRAETEVEDRGHDGHA